MIDFTQRMKSSNHNLSTNGLWRTLFIGSDPDLSCSASSWTVDSPPPPSRAGLADRWRPSGISRPRCSPPRTSGLSDTCFVSEKNQVDKYWSEVCGYVWKLLCSNCIMAFIAPLVGWWSVEQKVRGSLPTSVEYQYISFNWGNELKGEHEQKQWGAISSRWQHWSRIKS